MAERQPAEQIRPPLAPIVRKSDGKGGFDLEEWTGSYVGDGNAEVTTEPEVVIFRNGASGLHSDVMRRI